MQLSKASSSSPKKRDGSVSGPRLRKKHKRLDAICEEEYAKNHSEPNEDDDEGPEIGSAASNLELRRSSRVRRAPVLLDVSPSPVKKRRKMDKIVNLGVNKSLNSSIRNAKEKDTEKSVSPGVWGSRLRSRGRNVGFGVKSEESGEPSRRRNLFTEMDKKDADSEFGAEKGSEGGDLVVSEIERLDRFKELNDLGDEPEKSGQEEEMPEKEEEVVTSVMKEEMEVVGNEGEDSKMILESVLGVENVTEVVEADAKVLIGEEETKELSDEELKEDRVGDENVEVMDTTEKSDKERMQFEGGDEGENHRDGSEHDEGEDHLDSGEHDEVEDHHNGGEHNEGEDHKDGGEHVRISTNEVKDGSSDHQKDDFLATLEKKPVECENAPMVDAFNHGSDSTLGWPRIKQGRRCGLCGCGNDGKPPKRLIHDAGESENEVYSGSSASEEPNYDIWDGFGDEPGWLGRLLGPINDRYGIAGTWVHQHCAVWSPEVHSFD